mgnify:CR=1 FL=1
MCEVAPVPRLNVKNNLHHVRNTIHYGSLLRYGHTNMSTKEKSLLASLVITLLVFGISFSITLEFALPEEPMVNLGKGPTTVLFRLFILKIIVRFLSALLVGFQKAKEKNR